MGVIGKDSLVLAVIEKSIVSSNSLDSTDIESKSFSPEDSTSVVYSLASSGSASESATILASEIQRAESISPRLYEIQEDQIKIIARDIYTYIDQVKTLEGGNELALLGEETLESLRRNSQIHPLIE